MRIEAMRPEPRHDAGQLLGDSGNRRGRLLLYRRFQLEYALEGDIHAEARGDTQKKEYEASRYRFEHLRTPSRI